VGKKKTIPVTGCGGHEASRLPNFVDSRLIDGGEVVRVTGLPRFIPRVVLEIRFCYTLSRPQARSAVARTGQLINPMI
jgi:hypothetical protein